MAKLRFSIPGIGGSLGSCGVCGESFLSEILLGNSVDALKIEGCDRPIPVHGKCADKIIALQGPYEENREKFPEGPLKQAYEEMLAEQQTKSAQ